MAASRMQRRVEVHDIIIGKLLPLELPRPAERGFGGQAGIGVERRSLVRVFPVPKRLGLVV